MPAKIDRKHVVFKENIIASTKEQVEAQKVWWKHAMPYALGATICWGLSEQALMQPPATIAWVASKVLDVGMITLIVKGAFNFFVQLDKREATLQGRKIEKVEIPKKDFVAMQEEILRLKEEALRLQKENSAFKEKDVILDKVLLPEQKKVIQSHQESILLEKNNPTQDVQITQPGNQEHLDVIGRQNSEHFKSV